MNRFVEILSSVVSLLVVLGVGGWVLYRTLKKSEDPPKLLFKWILSAGVVTGTILFLRSAGGLGGQGGMTADYGVAFLIAGTTATCGIILGLIWAPNIGELVAKPFSSLFDGGDQEVVPQPLYSIAEARRKQGKYLEAIVEIRNQLARFPGDFTGTMMLAEIQAEDLNDLLSAQMTIEKLLSEPDRTPINAAVALNRLADWHLKYGQDPDSARSALEQIVQTFPDTEQAYLANQRIAHLTPREMLAEKLDPHRLKLGEYEQRLGLRADSPAGKPPEANPAELAANCVKHLQEFPLDTDAREQLALIYADHYQRLDMAADQMEEMIGQPHAPPRMIAHWLNVLADLHIKHAGDAAAARRALERIIELFPRSAAAETAKNRIAHLQLELRAKQKSQAVRLGSYEQNIGLKGRPNLSG